MEGAALREFAEETGLVIKSEDCQNGKLQMLALWEASQKILLKYFKLSVLLLYCCIF